MRAFALDQGPRRNFIAVSESTIDLWIKVAYSIGFKGEPPTSTAGYARRCRAAGLYLVRTELTLDDLITAPRKRQKAEYGEYAA